MNNRPLLRSKSTVTTKDWTLQYLLAYSESNFLSVPRVSASEENLLKIIKDYEERGEPLVIQGWNQHTGWPLNEFNIEYFCDHTSPEISVRNIHDWTDKQIPFSEFVKLSRAAPIFTSPEECERLYGKDAHCPEEWTSWLLNSSVVPSELFPFGSTDLFRYRPHNKTVETLMCYLGIGDTFTPCHKDLCASSGQNLMCYTENGGSSFWFMTDSSSALETSDYFRSLKQELDHETHVITLEELSRAPFKVYITEQKLGDLVLVPPRSCHQVVNYGGITIKTSWSRMTLQGTATAYYHELPIYRRVCRPETYQVKNTIYHALVRMTQDLKAPKRSSTSIPIESINLRESIVKDLNIVLDLFENILIDEYSPKYHQMACLLPEKSTDDIHTRRSTRYSLLDTFHPAQNDVGYLSCDFCGADIFQSFFECKTCVHARKDETTHGDGYIICAGCYVEGRSCRCEIMEAMQYYSFNNLLRDRQSTVQELQAFQNIYMPANQFQYKSDSELLSNIQLGTFQAACVLLDRRKNKKSTEVRVCSGWKKEDLHRVPQISAISCKFCHRSRCILHHLTEQRTHCIEVFLAQEADSSDQTLHRCHVGGTSRFLAGMSDFLVSHKTGSRPNLAFQLVYNAMKYDVCKPVNPKFVRVGWYDVETQIIDLRSDAKMAIYSPWASEYPIIAGSALGSPELAISDYNLSTSTETESVGSEASNYSDRIRKQRKRKRSQRTETPQPSETAVTRSSRSKKAPRKPRVSKKKKKIVVTVESSGPTSQDECASGSQLTQVISGAHSENSLHANVQDGLDGPPCRKMPSSTNFEKRQRKISKHSDRRKSEGAPQETGAIQICEDPPESHHPSNFSLPYHDAAPISAPPLVSLVNQAESTTNTSVGQNDNNKNLGNGIPTIRRMGPIYNPPRRSTLPRPLDNVWRDSNILTNQINQLNQPRVDRIAPTKPHERRYSPDVDETVPESVDGDMDIDNGA